MSNVTMSIEDVLLKKARKIAIDQDTTLSDLFRGYLTTLASQDDTRRSFIADEIDVLFSQSTASSGGIKASRDDLHER